MPRQRVAEQAVAAWPASRAARAYVVSAPIASRRRRAGGRPCSSASRPMSTSVSAAPSRSLSSGRRLWPPASTLASGVRADERRAPRRAWPGAGSRTPPGSCLASLRSLDRAPHGLRACTACRGGGCPSGAERVDDRVGHGRGARDRAGLADALDPERVDRRRRDGLVELEVREATTPAAARSRASSPVSSWPSSL